MASTTYLDNTAGSFTGSITSTKTDDITWINDQTVGGHFIDTVAYEGDQIGPQIGDRKVYDPTPIPPLVEQLEKSFAKENKKVEKKPEPINEEEIERYLDF